MTDSEREDFQFDSQWAKAVRGDQFLGSRNDVHLFSTEENIQLLSEADVLHADFRMPRPKFCRENFHE